MKKLLILLFSILISFNSYGLFGLFEDTVCVETDAQIRNDLYYLPNETKPFTGKNLCEYENGQYKSEGKYKNGTVDGKQTRSARNLHEIRRFIVEKKGLQLCKPS
jgi:antitoxin component YwqK of YwqJK toxin-antitoxin module